MRALLLAIVAAVGFVGVSGCAAPLPERVTLETPDGAGMQWNRYATENFEILSIDDTQGKWLYENVEHLRGWIFARWGMPDLKFRTKCRIFCAPDQDTFRRLFAKDQSSSRLSDGGSVVWLVLDGRHHVRQTPAFLTGPCLREYEIQTNVKLGLWVHRGLPILNQDLTTIRTAIGSLADVFSEDRPIYWGPELFQMTDEQLARQNPAAAEWFDREAAAACLLIRKEHGVNGWRQFVQRADPAATGRTGWADFNTVFKRFMTNLSRDVRSGETPDHYLTWKY